jgi:uncharacterized protein
MAQDDPPLSDDLDLYDWRRRVVGLYALPDIATFRAARDELFRQHPQSPVPPDERASFTGLHYFAIDPRYRVRSRLEPVDAGELAIDTGGDDGVVRYRRAGRLRVALPDGEAVLTVFRMVGYGGGLFLPFRDTTAPEETYGGGRYLVDSVKMTLGGALEVTPGSDEVVVDFNYAYNPSCAYDARWACPLAPPENRLSVAVRAGETRYH